MLSHRASGAPVRGQVLLLHGYPESSAMWRDLLHPVAAAGWRAVAPDLLGFGDTPADRPGTWERQVEAVESFRTALGLDDVVLVVHDWGGLIGLRWACEHPEAVRALVISDTGFFPDGRWHAMAKTMRTPEEGERLIDGIAREQFGQMLRSVSTGMTDEALDHYFQAYADEPRRRSQLDLYRSGDFSKLEAYDGQLGALGVPALILWGEDDPFAPVAGAKRFERELPDTELVVVDGAGHFVFADAPEQCAGAIVRFLDRLP
jgi:haloalkane dehalogenase